MSIHRITPWLAALSICGAAMFGGCGDSAPKSTSPPAASVAKPEVAKPFSTFEAAIDNEKVDSNGELPQVEKTSSITKTGLGDSTLDNAAIKESMPSTVRSEVQQPPISAIAPPTVEQLKQWIVEPYDALQLLVCRDNGDAGLLTNAGIIGNGSHYVLAGSRLTSWAVEKDEAITVFSGSANEQISLSLAVAPDGSWLASGDTKGNLRIWDLPDGKQRVAKKIYPSGVSHLSVSTDSQEIASSSYDGEITVWDPQLLTEKNKFKSANQSLQRILYIAPDRIAVAAQDMTIWNTKTRKLEHTLSTGGYQSTFALAPDNKRLAYVNDSALQLWSVSDAKVDTTIQGSFSNNELASFSTDGKRLVTAGKFVIRIWDVDSGRLLQSIDTFGWQTVGACWLPKSDLLLIASENGRVRLWGTMKSATELGWKPIHAPIDLPDAVSGEPAFPSQLLSIIDLRTFPRLPTTTSLGGTETFLNYSTNSTIDEAKIFYEYFLIKDGWTRSPDSKVGPDSAQYRKNGFILGVSLYSDADKSTHVNVNFGGNVDLRLLPRYDSTPVELVWESEDSVQYRTKADLLDLETTLIRKFYEAGWTSYARLNSSHSEQADQRDLQFLRDATELRISIQRPPVDPSSFHVSYSKNLTTKSLPIAKDSGFIEFDGSTEPYLVASTAMTLEQTRDYYDKEMVKQGWLRRDSGKQFTEETGWLEFIRGQCDVTIVLKRLPTARTQILVGKNLENASWQLKKSPETDPQVATNALEAADFPTLNGWSITKYDPEEKQVEFVANNATTAMFADAYTKELESNGWKTDGSGVKSEEYLLARFNKGKAEITLRATLSGNSVKATFSGDGLLWSKPLPGLKQLVSYETWLRVNQQPATLDLLDTFNAEMKTIATSTREVP